MPSETELEADIERLRSEKVELDKTKAALEVQLAKLAELQMALDIERASNEKNLGEAVRQADRVRWLEQEVEARNREVSDFMVEKDQMLRQMGKMSVDEKVANFELERLRKEVERLLQVSTCWEEQAKQARQVAAGYEQTEIVKKSQKVFESAEEFTREAYGDLAKNKAEKEEMSRACNRMEMQIESMREELDKVHGRNVDLEGKVMRLRHFHAASKEDLSRNACATPQGSVTSQVVPLSQIRAHNDKLLMMAGGEPVRKVKAKEWPMPKSFTDFSEYITTMKNFTKALQNLGHEEEQLAKEMVMSIASSTVGSSFLHELQKVYDCNTPTTIEETLSLLEACDLEH